MISTLEEIFLGNRELFQGLWIDRSDYNWQTYPVIRIDFSRMQVASDAEFAPALNAICAKSPANIRSPLATVPTMRSLKISSWPWRQGQVVILIDEYDKPLIDALPHLPEAQKIRETLRGFYTLIKAMDQYLRFVFITGISKFSKVGVFSDMNHLTDLTMNPHFATALGITETELQSQFHEHIAKFASKEGVTPDALSTKLREWYDGFCFVEECQNVYNPFSTLQLFTQQRFANYWFETGTPTFLIKLLKEQQYDVEELNDLRLRELAFNTYEIETLSIIPLLFQTGYLTIKGYEPTRRIYTLAYPNMEVEDAFLTYLLGEFSERDRGLNEAQLWRMIDALEAHDLDQFFHLLQVFFANVPYQIHLKYEKYYQTIFYLIFKLLGLRIDAEVETNAGRIDAVVEVADHIFLFEFKLDKSAEEALQQIRNQRYYQKYQLKGKSITLVGANFSSETRQVTAWQHEPDDKRTG
ncbi:MAG: AAA family ATPase [Caldilineaceae bacterium]